MEGKENLYYALGQLAYAVAMADGAIQHDEKEKLQAIVAEGIKHHEVDYNIAQIIFSVLDREKMDLETSYNWAIKDFKKYKIFLNDQIKADFIKVLEDVAESFESVSKEEKSIINRFKKDINAI